MLASSDGSVSVCWLAGLLEDDVKRSTSDCGICDKGLKGLLDGWIADQSFRQKYQGKAAKNLILRTR